jgi:hypothetical protein
MNRSLLLSLLALCLLFVLPACDVGDDDDDTSDDDDDAANDDDSAGDDDDTTNNCDGEGLDLTTNSDGDSSVIGLDIHYWSDLEELACGTNPLDPADYPSDDDGDGYCDSDCIGTVGCTQDTDGDGFHNWYETLCFTDPLDPLDTPAQPRQ